MSLKHEFYFSNYCKHSAAIIQELNRGGFQSKFIYICIDKRVVRDNVTYILLPGGKEFQMPPMINRVPVLLLKPKYEILSGSQILDYIKPQSKSINEEKTMIYSEPNPFDLGKDSLKSSGVMSDYFSFLEDGPQDLAPQGNGGMRQMYNYSGLDGQVAQMPVIVEGDKKSKMQYSLEELEQMRNSDFPSVKRT